MRIKFIFILIAVLLISGCSISFSKKANDTGGIFVSRDAGDTWQRINTLILENSKFGNIGDIDVNKIVLDPSDSNAVYVAGVKSGLFYSYDLNRGWQYVKKFRNYTIMELAVDPNNKCTIYVSVLNNIFRSDDCTREWKKIYKDNENKTLIYSIAIDPSDSNIIYAGTSRGELIVSQNKGESWKTAYRFQSSALGRIVIDPNNSNFIFYTTAKGKFIRSNFLGKNMEDLSRNLETFDIGRDIRDIIMIPDRPGEIFLATSRVILHSSNYGNTWEKIQLIPPDDNNLIRSMSIDPKNPNNIYYLTFTTFYRSNDGGKTWTTKKLPSIRQGRDIVVSPDNNKLIYMGVMKAKK